MTFDFDGHVYATIAPAELIEAARRCADDCAGADDPARFARLVAFLGEVLGDKCRDRVVARILAGAFGAGELRVLCARLMEETLAALDAELTNTTLALCADEIQVQMFVQELAAL